LKGGRNNIDVDTYMMFDTVSQLKALTDNKTTLRVVGYDNMESRYSEVLEKLYSEIAFAIMRTRASGDLTIGIARPTFSQLHKVLDMTDWHFKLSKKHDAVMLQGVKPQTPLFSVQCDSTDGYPRMRLVEIT
jgi:hypothetical protein